MTEKKRIIKPGQENLEVDQGPKGLLNQTPVSTPENGVPPSSLSRESTSKLVLEYSYENLKTTSIQVPRKLWDAFMIKLDERGYRRQGGRVIADLVAQWVDGTLQVNLPTSKGLSSLRRQLEENEIHTILQELDSTRHQGIKNPIFLREKLAKAAKKVKLTADLEREVRKELNLT